MKYLKILGCLALLQCFVFIKVYAQIKNEVQTQGIIFNGSISFNQLKAYDLAHPELKSVKLPEVEEEKEENEDAELKKKQLEGDKHLPTIGSPRKNNLKVSATLKTEAVNYCTNFRALNSNFTSYPPDVHGAVGFDHLVTTLNTQIRIQTKDSNIISTVALTSFWNPTGKSDVFDPRIMYDQISERWITMACASRKSAGSCIVLAASQTPDPTGTWNFYTIDADPADTLWFDYGNMGFSNDKICISGNMFNNIDSLPGDDGRMFTINKANVLNGVALGAITRTRGVRFGTCPAIPFDNNNTCYALTVWNEGFGTLKLYSITGSGASATVNDLGLVDYGSNNGWARGLGNCLPQSGSAIKVNGGDHRIQSVVSRNGKIFWANNFYWPMAAPSYCGIQYGSFTTSTRATLNLAGIWNATGDEMFCFPNLAVNGSEDVAVAFSYFSKTGFPSAAIAYGTNNLILNYNIVKAGEVPYTFGFPAGVDIRYRWGDYMSVSVDPTDDKGMWSISQYSRAPGNNNWGTWWAKICPSSCIANFSPGPEFANTVYKYEVTNIITAAHPVYSGAFIKHDAGVAVIMTPGFQAQAGCNYRAFIEGCGGVQ